MQAPETLKPVTHLISNLSIALIAVYLAINVGVVSVCVDSGMRSCALISALDSSLDFIPAIGRPVDFLLAAGNPERATLVSVLYSFAWLTGLAALAVMIAIVIVLGFGASPEKKQQAKYYFEVILPKDIAAIQSYAATLQPAHRRGIVSVKPDLKPNYVLPFGIVIFAAFLYVFWGLYSFQDYSEVANMVHVRNRDFFLMALGWSCLLFFSLFLLCGSVKAFLLRAPASPADQ